MSLQTYKAKRDFRRTREPAGRTRLKDHKARHGFVIQKHAARRLHYDFRLEMEGVLKSWAVPKGFPMRRGDRRLAVQVEDHPIEYADFEGTIPEGNYGAGTVMVWDRGDYETANEDPVEALEHGKIHFTLHGKKLKGDWALVRMRPREDESKPQWLLFKSGDDLPPLSGAVENRSVITSRTLEQIASARKKKEWQSDRPSKSAPNSVAKSEPARLQSKRALGGNGAKRNVLLSKRRSEVPAAVLRPHKLEKARLLEAKPGFVEPMKALLVEKLPTGPEWTYEIKFDGIRALTVKEGARIRLFSRAAKEMTTKYPEIVEALARMPAKDAVLDGEIVALDEEGRSSFQLLQSSRMVAHARVPLLYYVFDAINLDGKDLRGLPLQPRKAMAKALVSGLSPTIRFSAEINGESTRVVREMQSRGLEGLIAKRRDSKYESGRRSGAWLKFKWRNEQEFVIGGFTPPKGSRARFGAILVGYYEGNHLRFAAKVGTGFDRRWLESLYKKFQKLKQGSCPFVNLPEDLTRSSGRGLTRAQMKNASWLKPELVCEVRFAEWTRDGHLRQPAFLGLREDRNPREVVREKPTA